MYEVKSGIYLENEDMKASKVMPGWLATHVVFDGRIRSTCRVKGGAESNPKRASPPLLHLRHKTCLVGSSAIGLS